MVCAQRIEQTGIAIKLLPPTPTLSVVCAASLCVAPTESTRERPRPWALQLSSAEAISEVSPSVVSPSVVTPSRYLTAPNRARSPLPLRSSASRPDSGPLAYSSDAA